MWLNRSMVILIDSISSFQTLSMVPVWELSTCSIATFHPPQYRPFNRQRKVPPITATSLFSLWWQAIQVLSKERLIEWSRYPSRRESGASNLALIDPINLRRTLNQSICSMEYNSQGVIHSLMDRNHRDKCLIKLRRQPGEIPGCQLGKLRRRRGLGPQGNPFLLQRMRHKACNLTILVSFNNSKSSKESSKNSKRS